MARTASRRARYAFAALLAVGFASWAPASAQGVGDIVAVLRMEAPDMDEFIVRGTIPVPEKTYPRADGQEPFSILDDGDVVPAQVQLVTRYPRDEDGAAVVEVLAPVRKPPSAKPGDLIEYRVIYHPHPKGKMKSDPQVEALLSTPGSMYLVSRDAFGNRYGVELFPPGRDKYRNGATRVMRNGSAARQVVTYGTMVPESNNYGPPVGPLAHLFGVHAYFTGYVGENMLGLDLRINNGADGFDKDNVLDDPLGKVYFRSLELWVPKGWNVLQMAPDPYFGEKRNEGSWTAYSIVKPEPDGKMHSFPQQAIMTRRLALCPIGREHKARQYVEARNLAFVRRGNSPNTGKPLYSWWNEQTARYFTQNIRLPELDHVKWEDMGGKLEWKNNALKEILATGKEGEFPGIRTDRLGWAHPWGVTYGGMTGGTEIYSVDGITTVESASNAGYQHYMIAHRLYNDRMPDVLYGLNGQPTQYEEWIVQGSNWKYLPMSFYQLLLPGNDPFGFDKAPIYQRQYVQDNDLGPSYEEELDKYMPIDLQHHIRYTRSPKVLAWLGNDAMSKDCLRMRAEIYRLSYNPLRKDNKNEHKGSALFNEKRYVKEYPNHGFNFGRGHAWGTDSVAAAYAVSDPVYRATLRPWFGEVIDVVTSGQNNCNGFIQSKYTAKMLDGDHYARAAFEANLVENMLRGVLETVTRGVDGARTQQIEDIIATSVDAMISPMSWDPVQKGPWNHLAVHPVDLNKPMYCDLPYPPNAHNTTVQKTQGWMSLAHAYQLTGEYKYLDKAEEMIGGDLLEMLKKGKHKNIENTAALLALIQTGP